MRNKPKELRNWRIGKLKKRNSLIPQFLFSPILIFIRAYQLFISPWLGVNCRFLPTCSCYAHEAVSTHGIYKGGFLAAKRLLRCHPFAKAGYDPVPPLKNNTEN